MALNIHQNFLKANIQDHRIFGDKQFNLSGTYGNRYAANRAEQDLLQGDLYVKIVPIQGGYAVYYRSKK